MAHLLQLPEPPDAVFCCNDLLAVGAMHAALKRGVAIPDRIAVAGFDDIAEGAHGYPSLTTIAPDKAAIAEAAVSLAHQRTGPGRATSAEPQDVQTPFTLKIRESTAGLSR
ncbi:substrate-binding domain-containing protein [Actinomadura yumaensis]